MTDMKHLDLTGKSPVLIQLATLAPLAAGVFWIGYQGRAVVDEQRQTSIAVRQIQTELRKINNERWTYPMQRDYIEAAHMVNPDFEFPSASEIRERHLNP